MAAAASAQLSGLGTGLRTYTEGYDGDGQDTHQVQDVTGVSTLTGHSQAGFNASYASGSAVADSTASFGSLSVDFDTHTTHDATHPIYSVATSFSNPSAYFYDRVYVSGANIGQSVTVHITGLLSNVSLIYGNNNDQLNTPQGLLGVLDAYPAAGGDSFLQVANLRQGAVYTSIPSASCDVTVTVGSFFNISTRLYGDATVNDIYTGAAGGGEGQTIGTFLTGITSTTPGLSFIGDSGHVYQAVPEPSAFATLGLGLLVLRRRKSRSGGAGG